jgi:glycosyltransferase involved in cell wall biosynthesis
VDAYVALTEFGRQKFIAGGLPAEKVVVKPNFVSPDPGVGEGRGGYALFVGRLAPGKGLETLLEAWARHAPGMPLKILGDGPLAGMVREASTGAAGRVEWLGRRPLAEVYDAIGAAAVLVMPSIWYEGLPKTLIESFAKGTPVVASNLGALAECVTHGRTGLHFHPGDAADLARQIGRVATNGSAISAMRGECRRAFETHYTADRNIQMLAGIYHDALGRRHSAPARKAPREERAARPAPRIA